MVERRTLAGLTIAVVACLALRGAHIVFELQSPAEPFESEKIARNLVEGRGYSYTYWGKRMPTAGAPPGLVFVLAALYGTGVPEPDTVFRFLQAGLAAASLVLMWWLAARAFDQRVAWLAAGLFLFDLNLSFSVTWVQETALNIFLTLAGLCSLVWLSDRPRLGRAAVCGLVFGLGMLVRPTTGAIFAAGLAWFTLTATRSAKGAQNRLQAGSSPRAQTPPGPAARFKAVGVAVAVAVLVLAPWTLRNYLVFGRFIPVSQNLGLSLWYGYNPRATGSQVDVEGNDLVPQGELLEKLKAAENEVEIDQTYREAALAFLRDNTRLSLWLRVKSFAYYWLQHNYWLDTPRYPVSIVVKSANIALVAVFAIAFLLNLHRGGLARLFAITILVTCLTYTLIHADIGNRYRLQVEPLMLIFVAQLCVQVAGIAIAPPPPKRRELFYEFE